MLMMGFTADGQLRPELIAERDRRFNITTADKKEKRADIAAPPVQPGADSWQMGPAPQLQVTAARTGTPHGASQ